MKEYRKKNKKNENEKSDEKIKFKIEYGNFIINFK